MPVRREGHPREPLSELAGATPEAHDGVDLAPEVEVHELATPHSTHPNLRSWPRGGFPPKRAAPDPVPPEDP